MGSHEIEITAVEAERLVMRIGLLIDNVGSSATKLAAAMTEAHEKRIDRVLGFESWQVFAQETFGAKVAAYSTEIKAQLAGILMIDSGMSTRAAAAAVGVSQKTASRILQRERTEVSLNDSPARLDLYRRNQERVAARHEAGRAAGRAKAAEHQQDRRVVGLDGKAYAPQSKQQAPRRTPITTTVDRLCLKLEEDLSRLIKLSGDDRAPANVEAILERFAVVENYVNNVHDAYSKILLEQATEAGEIK